MNRSLLSRPADSKRIRTMSRAGTRPKGRGMIRFSHLSAASLAFGLLLSFAPPLTAKTLTVPADFPTIKSAVYAAADGDVIVVDDGYYLETNVVVDKAVRIAARNPYGAVIYGSMRTEDFVFQIRAAAEIEGFVFKRGRTCIIQRHSPDVLWKARDLAIFDFNTSISINAVDGNLGRAEVENIFVSGDGATSDNFDAISTNDANSLEVRRAFVMNCPVAYAGFNHLSFRVEDTVILDCPFGFVESSRYQPIPPGTCSIQKGGGVHVLNSSSLGDPSKLSLALSALDAAVGVSEFQADPPGTTAARDALRFLARGRIFRSMGRWADSEAWFKRARRAAETAGSEEFMWQADLGSARLRESRKDYDGAADWYRSAIGLVDRWLSRIPSGLSRVNFLEDKAPVYLALIGLLLDRHEGNPAGRYVEEAFISAEEQKSCGIPRIPVLKGPALTAAPEAVALKVKIARDISVIQTALQDPDLAAEEKEALCSDLEKAEEEWNALLIRYGESPRNSGPGGGRADLDFARIRDRLRGRPALIYALGEKESFAFLAGESGIKAARLPGRDAIESMVDGYLKFLQLEGTPRFMGWKGGKILYDVLLGPFRAEIEDGPRSVVVVPCGRLRYLPFEALVEREEADGTKGRFWGEGRSVTYAASLSAALAEKEGGGISERPVLALGHSGGIRCDNRARNLKQFFHPLAHAEREAKTLARFFPRAGTRLLLGREAAESRLKRMELSEFGIVHVATHGIIDDVHWWRSALLLEPEAAVPEDGFLTAMEIPELDLDAPLVVLSACGTGLGSLYRGEGIRGLAGAFMAAGADNLVVSLWSVDDEASAEFMEAFYRKVGEGASPADALRDVKLRMIGSKYGNPRFWAPFVLIGKSD